MVVPPCRSQFMRQLQAQLLQSNPTTVKKTVNENTPKSSNKNKQRYANKKPPIVIDLEEDTTDEVRVLKKNTDQYNSHGTDDFERPKLKRSLSSGSNKTKRQASTIEEQPTIQRTNSRMRSTIVEDNRMVVDEDEDTEINYSQLSNSAGLLLVHSSQKSNISKTSNKDTSAASKPRKNRKEVSSDNYPLDAGLSTQDRRNRLDFSNGSIFVLHPQMESQLKEAQTVLGSNVIIIDTTNKYGT